MTKYILILISLFCLQVAAQPFETQKKQIPAIAPQENAPELPALPPTLQLKAPNNPFTLLKQPQQPENQFMKQTEKSIDFTGKSNLVHRKIEFKPNYSEVNDHKREDAQVPKGDQFFGDFVNNGNAITVYCRDYADVDGDRISVFVNDEEQVRDVFLTNTFRGFVVKLKPGFNKIEFLALNQGEAGPNTAEFQVIDEKNQVIARNYWALATGSKAQFVIIKNE